MDLKDCRSDLPAIILYNLDLSWPKEDIQDRLAATQELEAALVAIGHPVRTACVQSAELIATLREFHPDEYLVFNWCEELPGVPHSEYQVAQQLEEMGFAFTGTGACALYASQDKRRVKRILESWKIPTPAWQIYASTAGLSWRRFPAIVKPVFEHCSYGITRDSVVQSCKELERRIQYVLEELHQPALVEEFLDSREFHVGVIGNGRLRVLPAGEIDYTAFSDIHDRLCTYEANVDKGSRAYQLTLPKLPAALTDQQVSQLEKIVIAAYRALDCRDYARLDIRLQENVFYLLDVNPNPDISSDTSLVRGAELDGLSYGMLGSVLINLAAQRHPIFRRALPVAE